MHLRILKPLSTLIASGLLFGQANAIMPAEQSNSPEDSRIQSNYAPAPATTTREPDLSFESRALKTRTGTPERRDYDYDNNNDNEIGYSSVGANLEHELSTFKKRAVRTRAGQVDRQRVDR